MDEALGFAPYRAERRAACLALFDANCPAFFAPNERRDYEAFLDRAGEAYTLAALGDRLAGAFGLMPADVPGRAHLNWILLHPERQGAGLGRTIMAEARRQAQALSADQVDIAASQHSAPFFARFGAEEVGSKPDGWGPGMHRIDMVWRPANHFA